MSLLKIVLALVIVYLLVKLAKWAKYRKQLVEAVEKLPGPPNISFLPIINHAVTVIYLDFLKHKMGTSALFYHFLANIHSLFSDAGICRFWLGPQPVVVLYSPETVESLLSSTVVLNKAQEYDILGPWIKEGLITSKKNKWRVRRKILTPAFHFRILNDFLPIMNQEASRLVRKLNQLKYVGEEKVFDIAPPIGLCTLDTICETAMGIHFNCQDDEHSIYVQSLNELAENALARVTRPWLWIDFIYHRSEYGKKFLKANKIIHEFTSNVTHQRKLEWQKHLEQVRSKKSKETGEPEPKVTLDDMRDSSLLDSGNKKLAFLDLLLHQHLIEKTMTISDIQEEVDTFMFAGQDTTGWSISWTLYMLGLNEDIQTRVRDELDSVIEDGEVETFDKNEHANLAKKLVTTDITGEHLKDLRYLDRVIKESLRMWPSVPFVARKIDEDLVVADKYLVPKGSTCTVLVQALHNNPKYYPKPEVFDPDRFLPENSVGRHPYAYVPFSAGPRNCIGQKFATMELKVIVAKVLKNYYIKTVDHRDKLAVVGELVLRSRNGLNVRMIPRFR